MKDLLGKSILVIDDDLNLLKLAARILTYAGAQVYTAPNGQEGLDLFSSNTPDLVLLDVMLPGIDGWEVCRQIRRLSNVPIIMFTVLDRETHRTRGRECGADDHLTKPFSVDVLLSCVRAAFRRAELSEGQKTGN